MRPNAPVPKAAGAASPGPIAATSPGRARATSGTASGMCRAMLPSVSLPSSPYADASGSSPAPTLSSTMTMALVKGDGTGQQVVRRGEGFG